MVDALFPDDEVDFDALVIEPLGRHHNRTAFSCGHPELDRYLIHQAGQDIRRRISRTFICAATDNDTVLGFYTLSALSLNLKSLPERIARKLPRHPIPCALVGRLAIDRSAQGRGLGSMLLADAVQRAKSAADSVAIYAMVVDAKDDGAKRFYAGYGFMSLQDNSMRLFLPLGSTDF